jgi:uracil-DNA glycosylase
MKFWIGFDEHGKHTPVMASGDDSSPLFLSEAAFEFILKQADANGLVCKTCALVVRSKEIEDGKCKAGMGCNSDPVLQEYARLPPAVANVAIGQRAFKALNTLSRHVVNGHRSEGDGEGETPPESGTGPGTGFY